MDHTYAIIMAGGGGTRLWPISRTEHPKHVLPLIGDRSLFQNTMDRLAGVVPMERIYVVTTTEQRKILKIQAPELPVDHFLIEPQPRGTASVVGLAATVLLKQDPDAVMLVFPADHIIRNVDLFQSIMRVAVKVARRRYLVTVGITPTFPATGYGYVKRGTDLVEKFEVPVYQMEQFIEKPDEANALRMMESGGYSWNSGIFIWRADRILDEFANQMPNLRAALERIGKAWGSPACRLTLESEWASLNSETIDYGIMENAHNVAVIPVEGLKWSDVGSWDSIFDILSPDEAGNVVVNCLHIPFDTRDTLVYSTGKKLVVTIGVDDLILVDSEDALLVCHRNQAQRVREVSEYLKKLNQEKYL